ncbi:MAG TPA: pantoate--beta-alanine ligase [Arcobacter sp.]|nr:pantoate--beta-alanine ligase [Arcobacter sp.]HIP56436.1 pantoate--beta-alanine ligase [Arcobacter sp.]
MKIIKDIQELKQELKLTSESIGFVPTMGALHEGHISLIKQARDENELVVVSIFVNPTQFLQGEDFSSYPSKDLADTKICELAKVDILFMPDTNTIYKKDELSVKAPQKRSYILEGFGRPGHFDGVLQIVLKLFNIVRPTNAYFGKKDAQQLSLIKQMVSDLFMDINIIECEIIRDDDGLALSSRNTYLGSDEKKLALNIVKSLRVATQEVMTGTQDIEKIKKSMEIVLKDMDIEYIEILSRDFKKLENIELKNSIILVAIRVGTTRLIDNIWI